MTPAFDEAAGFKETFSRTCRAAHGRGVGYGEFGGHGVGSAEAAVHGGKSDHEERACTRSRSTSGDASFATTFGGPALEGPDDQAGVVCRSALGRGWIVPVGMESGLSQITLEWMLCEAVELGCWSIRSGREKVVGTGPAAAARGAESGAADS